MLTDIGGKTQSQRNVAKLSLIRDYLEKPSGKTVLHKISMIRYNFYLPSNYILFLSQLRPWYFYKYKYKIGLWDCSK